MAYEWLSTDSLYYNHLCNNVGDWLCPNGRYFEKERKAKNDPNKKYCETCAEIYTDSHTKPITYCPNVLHINRKIFI